MNRFNAWLDADPSPREVRAVQRFAVSAVSLTLMAAGMGLLVPAPWSPLAEYDEQHPISGTP